jgi:hypothetical protein
MDSNTLLVSFMFGTLGMGMFMYGKKAGRLVPLGAGLALLVIPYCIPNLLAMTITCCAISVVPWLLRGA